MTAALDAAGAANPLRLDDFAQSAAVETDSTAMLDKLCDRLGAHCGGGTAVYCLQALGVNTAAGGAKYVAAPRSS